MFAAIVVTKDVVSWRRDASDGSVYFPRILVVVAKLVHSC